MKQIKTKQTKLHIKGIEVDIPNFILKHSPRRYFYTEDGDIYKQCATCEKKYLVLKYDNNEFIDVHKEEEYRTTIEKVTNESYYSSYCTNCYIKSLKKDNNIEVNTENKEEYIKSKRKRNIKEKIEQGEQFDNIGFVNIPVKLIKAFKIRMIEENTTQSKLFIKAIEHYLNDNND